MNVLLKIVQGPNAGAEIVLAEGMTVSLGKGDSCDILLADQSLADVACELEVNAERVRMLLPGGAEERLEPFRVKFIGETTAIAIGPETGMWNELAWPVRGSAAVPESEGETSDAQPPRETSAADSASASAKKKSGCRGCGCAMALLLPVPLVAVALVFLLWPFRSQVAGLLGPSVSDRVRPAVRSVHGAGLAACGFVRDFVAGCVSSGGETAVSPLPRIADIAAEYGLSCIETNGSCVLSGNLPTRAQRLSATAAAYAARPGVVIDVSDDESLRSATSEVLDLVGEGSLKVHSATNGIVILSGFSPGASGLRNVLEAIRADVPHVKNVDCAQVRLGEALGEPVPADAASPKPAVKGIRTARVRQDKLKGTAPKMPVVGVLTVPYPCIVLKDGSRVTEGAEFGGFTIDKIGADTIRIRGPEGVFEWRP